MEAPKDNDDACAKEGARIAKMRQRTEEMMRRRRIWQMEKCGKKVKLAKNKDLPQEVRKEQKLIEFPQLDLLSEPEPDINDDDQRKIEEDVGVGDEKEFCLNCAHLPCLCDLLGQSKLYHASVCDIKI